MLLSLCGRFPECFFFLYLRMERIFSHSQLSPWFFFGSFYIWFDFLSPFNRCVVYVYLFVYWNSSVRLFYFFCLICSAFSVTRCIFGYTHNAFAVDLGEWKPSGQKKNRWERERGGSTRIRNDETMSKHWYRILTAKPNDEKKIASVCLMHRRRINGPTSSNDWFINRCSKIVHHWYLI